MKLSSLTSTCSGKELVESVNSIYGDLIRSDPEDDTNCLVAYRCHLNNKKSNFWAVLLNGHEVATLIRQSKNWVGVNWDIIFITKHNRNLPPGFQQIMTAKNRSYLEGMLNQLTREIAKAISDRHADVVRLPIDPAQL